MIYVNDRIQAIHPISVCGRSAAWIFIFHSILKIKLMSTVSNHRIHNLFLQQSYQDAWEDYLRALSPKFPGGWNYVILTASNAAQAGIYEQQFCLRRKQGKLPPCTHFAVLPDPDGQRIGSGGATLNVLQYVAEREGTLNGQRILVIHSGGDSKRIPQYSACGKLFSPVPRLLPDQRSSTLFDELLIASAGLAGRVREGMLVLSGDVLLLFNPLQIDLQMDDAVAISCKKEAETGQHHGVFLNDGKGIVKQFLHKNPLDKLRAAGAVDEQGRVDIDTGAVFLARPVLQALLQLVSTEGKSDPRKWAAMVNDRVRLSFYGDFLYPLASDSSLEQFYQEKAEGPSCPELLDCRKQVWEALHPFRLKMMSLSPAEFIHFGTTGELLALMTRDIDDCEFLGWQRKTACNHANTGNFSGRNSLVSAEAHLAENCYIEDSRISGEASIGENCVISNLTLKSEHIPSGTVLHALQLQDGKHCVRIYGIEDDIKGLKTLFSVPLGSFSGAQSLWETPLYPACRNLSEAVSSALKLYQQVHKLAAKLSGTHEGSLTEILGLPELFAGKRLYSLADSFAACAPQALLQWQEKLSTTIRIDCFLQKLKEYRPVNEALQALGKVHPKLLARLEKLAETLDTGRKMRLYYFLSKAPELEKERERLTDRSFATLREAICRPLWSERQESPLHFREHELFVELPVRVNWGGGWSDTPPYCNEHGGCVLNAAVKLQGQCPIRVTIRKLSELQVEFASADAGTFGVFHSLEELLDCHNPFDPFALHKASLQACGIIPSDHSRNLQQVLEQLGGGIYLNTQVVNVPRGSGLGTSSILACACAKALAMMFGQATGNAEICRKVLAIEQIMSTGGGWQDQFGGLLPGIKMIRSTPGWKQEFQVEPVCVSAATQAELQQRFALISTGQRRLARNLLREVTGKYIAAEPAALRCLNKIQRLAVNMRQSLEAGDLDAFAVLLNQHWGCSKTLDAGCSNTCIEHIFLVCEDLLAGRFIAGAGGGGFLQVILKKNASKPQLQKRLQEFFPENVVLWDSEFVF